MTHLCLAAVCTLPMLGTAFGTDTLLCWGLPRLAMNAPLTRRLPQELATLQILLLYSTPFKEAFGEMLLAFYPHIGCERRGPLLGWSPAVVCTPKNGRAEVHVCPSRMHVGASPFSDSAALPCPALACRSAGQAARCDQGAGPADGAGLPPGGGWEVLGWEQWAPGSCCCQGVFPQRSLAVPSSSSLLVLPSSVHKQEAALTRCRSQA